MKRVYLVIITVLCMLMLSACAKENSLDEIAQAVEEGKTAVVSTPYADLKIPEVFQGVVTNEVTSTEPYTVTFKASADNTELFSVIFGGKGDILLGTLLGEEDNTVIYTNVPELDSENKHYTEYRIYQDGINTILNNLVADYNFAVNLIVEPEDKETFAVEAGGITFYYPAKWQDTVQTEVTDNGVCFSSNGSKLFALSFTESENGLFFGTYKQTPIYIMSYEIDKAQYTEDEYGTLRMMQEDLDTIVDNLMEDPNFVLG